MRDNYSLDGLLAIVTLAIGAGLILGLVWGATATKSNWKAQLIQNGTGYYNSTNAQFEFVNLKTNRLEKP